MLPKINALLLLIANVIIGLVVLILVQQLKLDNRLNALIVFTAFVLLNLAYLKLFRLNDALRTYWSMRKISWLLPGTAAGALLVLLPGIAALLFKYKGNPLIIKNISFTSTWLTFLITGWEELWFRGLMLNRCNRVLSPFVIAVATGLFFMLIHAMNPAINLMHEGPVLFFAGTLLSSLYFCYRNIWLPLGVHFGNNFFGGFLSPVIEYDPVFGSNGYVYTACLGLAAVFFLWRVSLKRPTAI